jgi:ribosomal protein S1
LNPFLSLLIVLCSIVIVVKFLQFISQKIYLRKSIFSRRDNTLRLSRISLLSTIAIDDKYKVVVLNIDEKQKTILLGPTNATILDERQNQSFKDSSKIESIAS